jgi:hypothetical protein
MAYQALVYSMQMIALFVIVDLCILATLIMAIVSGDPGVYHIPFWDWQLKMFVSLIS